MYCDLSDIALCQNIAQGRFYGGGHARIEIHSQLVQNFLTPSAFPLEIASGTKQ